MDSTNPKQEYSVATALERLADAIDKGPSEALTAILETSRHFWNYSFGNQMLIAWQRPTASKVAGIRTWNKLGRRVLEGERGIRILAPIVLRNRDRAADSDDAETILRFRTVAVFDVAQTDGEPLPEETKAIGDPGENLARLVAFATAKGIALDYRETVAGDARGASYGGRIAIRADLAPADSFRVLVHELAHEILGHHGAGLPSQTEELEAECVAYVVASSIGIETETHCADYLISWKADRDAMRASLARIQGAVKPMMEALHGTRENVPSEN